MCKEINLVVLQPKLKSIILVTQSFINRAIFHAFFCLLIFFKLNLFQNSYMNTTRVSNSFDPDQARLAADFKRGRESIEDDGQSGRLSGLILVQTVCKGYQQMTLTYRYGILLSTMFIVACCCCLFSLH